MTFKTYKNTTRELIPVTDWFIVVDIIRPIIQPQLDRGPKLTIDLTYSSLSMQSRRETAGFTSLCRMSALRSTTLTMPVGCECCAMDISRIVCDKPHVNAFRMRCPQTILCRMRLFMYSFRVTGSKCVHAETFLDRDVLRHSDLVMHHACSNRTNYVHKVLFWRVSIEH